MATQAATATNSGVDTSMLEKVKKSINTQNFGGVFIGTLATYALVEVVHHVLLEQYLMGWLATTTLSATTMAGIYYGALVVTIGVVAWGIWKLFCKKTE